MLTVEFKEVDENICSTIKKEKKECAKFPDCHSEFSGYSAIMPCPLFLSCLFCVFKNFFL